MNRHGEKAELHVVRTFDVVALPSTDALPVKPS
jgi:hypothetical protein